MISNALTTAAALWALAAAAPPAAQPITGGPLVPGVCIISPEAVLTGSKVGQAATAHLQQYAADAQRELQTDRSALDSEAHALQTVSKTAPAAQLDERRQTLATKVNALQSKTDERSRALEYTRVRVVQRISQQAQPLIAVAYKAHGCGLLLRRENVLGGNLGNDLTPEVMRGLDAKLVTLDFQLETPPPTAKPAA
jgi:Skp family chaperone for outer membrane proteins